MRTSRRLSQFTLALFALLMSATAALAADPGNVYPPESEVSDQKAGSVLVYNLYSSAAAGGNTNNTRFNITNASSTSAAFVHLFFVSDACSVADSYICLTANQTASFLASDVDPGIKGYMVAIAVDRDLGCPVAHNWLIGDEYVKLPTNHAANLGAEAFAALFAGILPTCNATSPVAEIFFNGLLGGYNRVPRVLAASSIPSRQDNNSTMIIINRIGGNLGIGAATLSTLFGLLYDDAENVFSYSLSGGCQLMQEFTPTAPRTTPRFDVAIPAGRSGWTKISSQSDIGILGAILNFNQNAAAQASAFNGGRNLHKLTLSTSNSYTIPIFPPSC